MLASSLDHLVYATSVLMSRGRAIFSYLDLMMFLVFGGGCMGIFDISLLGPVAVFHLSLVQPCHSLAASIRARVPKEG